MGKWRYKKKSKIYTYRKRDNVDIANQSSNSITEKRKNNNNDISMEITIPVLSNTSYDLSKFDFSFKDIKIVDINSDEFEAYIEAQQPNIKEANMSFPKSIIENAYGEYDKKYAIIKNNPKENFKYTDIIIVWKILLIIFPSDLQIEYDIVYTFEDGFFQRSYMSSYQKRGDYENYLFSDDEYLEEINEYIRLVFDRLNLTNYIGIAIENYLTSYSASHIHYQYLTLCIALESIISGNQELIYRIRRSVAILCGKDLFNCHRIYDNLNKLYTLRSKIIHGESFDYKKVAEYLPPLKSIVSRTIIELLIHNIPTNTELNLKITEVGFGDRTKISESWKHFTLNIITHVESNWKKIE